MFVHVIYVSSLLMMTFNFLKVAFNQLTVSVPIIQNTVNWWAKQINYIAEKFSEDSAVQFRVAQLKT